MYQYRVLFDVSQKPFQWWFPAAGLVFVVLGGAVIWTGHRKQWPLRRKLGGYFIVGFACFWSLSALLAMLPMYRSLRSAVQTGDFAIVEGHVTNFRPMPFGGHQLECFSVSPETFCYSDYVLTAGFNNTASHGGPIREGLPVRVSYIGGTIVRLEVRADALPSVEQGATFAQKAELDWQRQMQRDPALDRLYLGFAIAALFMTGWWNLQPMRFMKFWLKPPYKDLTVLAFRVFFALSLIGAASSIVKHLRDHHGNWSEYRQILEIAVIWMAAIFVIVILVEWMNRKADAQP
jgi:hypothetical protein